jgi:gentisate 1,2-dioxygenase
MMAVQTSDDMQARELMVDVATFTDAESRQAFYARIGERSMTPLWENLHALVLAQPATPAQPHLWQYDDMARPFLMEAGQLITAREAERRVLILENPGIKGSSSVTRSLYAGLQLVLPGDVAPAHRHTQNALRFIVEGSKAYTAVNGERTLMHPGDLVLTPAWHWHDHGNDSELPMVWLDALDIPMVAFFDTSFSEMGNAESQTVVPMGDSDRRFGNNLAPVDWQPATQSSPIFNYPYARTLETLQSMAQGDAPDDCHGHKLRYVNPANGGHVTPTMAAFMQLLPAGFSSHPYRSTDGTVFSVVEGEGESTVGGRKFRWQARDVFVVPSWMEVTHRAGKDAVLFSFSDRSAQEKLGLWREQRN